MNIKRSTMSDLFSKIKKTDEKKLKKRKEKETHALNQGKGSI